MWWQTGGEQKSNSGEKVPTGRPSTPTVGTPDLFPSSSEESEGQTKSRRTPHLYLHRGLVLTSTRDSSPKCRSPYT